MNGKQIKKLLLDKDLTVAGMARQLATAKLSEESARQMISQMIHGRRFYPALAKRVERRFGVRLERQIA